MARRPSSVTTVITASDTTLKATRGKVWWITISNSHASASAAIELDNGGSDVWGVVIEAVDISGNPFHAVFDPPIEFDTSIIIDITGGTVQATVAFT